MGNFYTNISLVGASAQQAAELLTELGRQAYVADAGQSCVVFDRECEAQDSQILSALAEHLATALDCVAFAVLNHDDSILWFQVYRGSDLALEYSNRGGPTPNARDLCALFGRRQRASSVWFYLTMPFLFQVDRHRLLVTALGLPAVSIGAGHKYVSQGEVPYLEAGQSLLQTPLRSG